jgi:2-(1,2-epoxy-1,2-dihydrophenyl)acetyl-CoA isomerase
VPDPLLVERADAVTTLTLNRPDSLNSLDNELRHALAEELRSLTADRSCRAVVLTGAGRSFCVGQDLREHVANLDSGAADPFGPMITTQYNPIATLLAELNRPVIAAVRGMAAGAGASLALLCDFRIGGPKTSFLTAFASIGLAGDTGASWSLPRLVGHAKAIELLMLSEPVPAAEALRLGLLTRLVDDDDLILPTAQEFAGRLAAGPTVAYGQIKRQLAVGGSDTLAAALAAELEAQRTAGATEDHRGATYAFTRKEKPTFDGR